MKPAPILSRLLLLAAVLGTAGLLRAATPGFTFKRGVNISHWLSQNNAVLKYADPAWFNESDVAWIAAQGFDHIRLAVDVRLCLAPDGSLDPAKLKPVDDTIGWARAKGLGLVFDAHFLPGADFNTVGRDSRVYTDAVLIDKVAGVWRQLAKRYAAEGDWLRFEILNEPVADENKQLNPFQHRMLAAIRESNPTRIVYLTSNKWGQFASVPDVELPADRNIALTIHNYEPFVFTHQQAPWAGFDDKMPAVKFPGIVPELAGHVAPGSNLLGRKGEPLTVAKVDEAFAKVEAWVQKTRPGLEVYVGEFGVYRAADADSMRNWIYTLRHNCEKRGWGWAVWDYKGGFAVRGKDGQGTPILDGLFKVPAAMAP